MTYSRAGRQDAAVHGSVSMPSIGTEWSGVFFSIKQRRFAGAVTAMTIPTLQIHMQMHCVIKFARLSP